MEKYYYSCELAGFSFTFCFCNIETFEYFNGWLNPSMEQNILVESSMDEIKFWKTKWCLQSLAYTEYHLSYYKTCEYLLQHKKCIFHGAVFGWNKKAYILTAPSGTGKSTQLKNWIDLYGKEIDIINGDKPILSCEDGKILVYPTPWKGKEGWGRDDKILKLGGIIYLEQGSENSICKLDIRASIPLLLKRILFRCLNEPDILNACSLLEDILNFTPVYRLINKGDLESSKMTHDYLIKDVIENEI